MALKNQGVYILADAVSFEKKPGGVGFLTVTLSDPERHGIVNGGHTFAAIRAVLEESETAEESADESTLDRAYVRLHIYQGIDKDKVPDIAEGLNRSKQVDDPSLDNLKGHFEIIQKVMEGKPGGDQIA